MKNVVLWLALIIFSSLNINTVYAGEDDIFPDYLWGNKNFIICGAHMGVAGYIDKSSLVVKKYNPPEYELSVIIVYVPNADLGNTRPDFSYVCNFYYNWDERKMYGLSESGTWEYIYPVGSFAKTGHYFPGEMAFYLAYNKKFYGGREWYDADYGRYIEPSWGDWLYRVVDNAR